MDDQPNNRSARIQGRWRHLIHLSIFLLGAAALFLRLGGDNDGYWNFLLSNNNIEDEEDEGHRRHLLRDTVSRRTAVVNCSKFNRRRRKCRRNNGCTYFKSDKTCKNIVVNNMNQNSAGNTATHDSCHSWHPSIKDPQTW